MTDEKMPAAEAVAETEDQFSYELAFHVLPTVAEGEVTGVVEKIKTLITNAGGTLGAEEMPQRVDLAYEVIKHLEGKNRRFTSAYFGWVRFTAEAAAVADITSGVDEETNILRHLLIRLTKAEEENPFYYHEALASQKQVSDVDDSTTEVVAKTEEVKEEKPAEVSETDEAKEEESAEIDEAAEEKTEEEVKA